MKLSTLFSHGAKKAVIVSLLSCLLPVLLLVLTMNAQSPSSQGLILSQESSQAGTDSIAFRWAFVAQAGGKEKKKISVVHHDTTLFTGDHLKLFVRLDRPAYIYIFLYNSKQELKLLFPYTFEQFTKDYATDKNYFIPKGREWFNLDKNTGEETFYLLASRNRLPEIENLYMHYNKAEDKQSAADQLLTEISNLKKQTRKFATLAEKPVAIAGNVRGEEAYTDRTDISQMATEIEALGFYSKTITVDHR